MAKNKTSKKKSTTVKKVVVEEVAPEVDAKQIIEKKIVEPPVKPVPTVKFKKAGLTPQEVMIIETKYSGLAELANKKFSKLKEVCKDDREYSLLLTRKFGI